MVGPKGAVDAYNIPRRAATTPAAVVGDGAIFIGRAHERGPGRLAREPGHIARVRSAWVPRASRRAAPGRAGLDNCGARRAWPALLLLWPRASLSRRPRPASPHQPPPRSSQAATSLACLPPRPLYRRATAFLVAFFQPTSQLNYRCSACLAASAHCIAARRCAIARFGVLNICID